MANIYDYRGNVIDLDTNKIENLMNTAIAYATELISGGHGGHVVINRDGEGKPQQIYILDTENTATARNVWRFDENGLSHSHVGYYGPYNDIALTPDGKINASMITTGELNADLLTTGTIIDATGENFWNLITGQLQISGNARIGNNTFNNTINELVSSVNNYTDTKFDDYSSAFNGIVSGLQNQIDGQIESWYYDYQPTLNNIPASNWQTEEDRKKHQGDIFYWQSTGYVYRFTKLYGQWQWKIVEDSQITQAIAAAQEANQIANSKMRVFTSTPYPPYNLGDLWVQGIDGDILKCIRSKAVNQNFSLADWAKASKYTDDSSFQNWLSGDFSTIIAGIEEGLADQKISTYYQAVDPSLEWSTPEQMDLHQGDIWFNSSEYGTGYYRWSGRVWQEIQAAPSAEFIEIIENKADIYTSSTVPAFAKEGDLWFRGPNYPIYTYVNGQWLEYNKYTDNSELVSWINNEYQADLEIIQGQIDRKAETWYQADDPALYYQWDSDQKQKHYGDLWYCTSNGKTFRYNGVTWIEQEVPQQIFDAIDGKAQVFIQDPNAEDPDDQHPSPPYNARDLWVQGADGDILICVQSRAQGDQFDEDDWVYASKYGALIDAIGQQLDNKVNTYYSSSNPMSDWDVSEYQDHIGDLWCDPTLNVISVFNGTSWDAQTSGDIPQEIFDKLDGVSQIFTQVPPATPTVPYYVDDIWIQGANGDMMKCIHARTAQEQYNAADWVKATKYDKGQDAINVIIDSSAGNVFLKKDITTTLTCTVIKGNGTDITNRVTSFHWIKKNADGTVDTSWNRNLAGNTITLTEADVNSKAIFVCEVQFQEE